MTTTSTLTSSDLTKDLSKTLDPTGKNVIEIIKEEHRLVDTLYERYQSSHDVKEKQGIAYNIIKLLSIHGAAEEMSLYPYIKTRVPNGESIINHALNEHQQMKQDLYALDQLEFGAAGYDTKLAKAIQDTKHHVKEEESTVLPALEKNCSPDEIQKMTQQFISSKSMAPSRPHPDAPNEPPGNKVANSASVPLDAARDIGRFS